MPKKPPVALRKPPPAVDPQAAERFVSTGASTTSSGNVPAPGRRRAVITRTDGRELRRMTVYLPPELARRLAVYAAKTDIDVSAAIASICEDFLGRAES